jgi:hypothetical protein
MTRMLRLALAATLILGAGCSSSSSDSPTAPTAVDPETPSSTAATAETSSSTAARASISLPFAAVSGPTAVTFPPRDQALRFRQDLEAYYRDVFRRGSSQSFVDIEGTIVWTQEYLRYRVNGCGHNDGVARVMAQIDGSTNTAACSSQSTPFPPRNEPFAFRQSLETKYRDGLRSGVSSTFVDQEGDIVWTTEYLRYRTTGCSHEEATAKVREQLGGAAASAGCAPPPPAPDPVVASFIMRQGTGGNVTTVCNVNSGNCILDGSDSSGPGGISSYQWATRRFRANGVNEDRTFSGRTVTLGPDCTAGVNANTQERFDVTLTVRSGSGQSATQARTLSLARAGCGT